MVGTLFAVIIFKDSPFIASTVVMILCLLLLRNELTLKNLYFYLVIGINGVIAEAVAVYFGLWQYASPNFLGVPLWLGFVWGNTGFFIIKLYKLFEE